MAAMALPVLVHLWNTRKSKSLQVGSVAFFEEASEKKSWQKRISDPLLLLVRLLFIAALAFMLARPFLKSDFDGSDKKGWVVLGRENIGEVYRQFQPTIDSLIRAGFEPHYFDANFPPLNLEQALKDSTEEPDGPSYWAIAASLDKIKPKDFPAYIFTNNKLKNFYGPRIPIAQKWFLGKVAPSAEAAVNVMTDTTTLEIGIVEEAGKIDGDYLKAALEAISKYGKRKMKISLTSDLKSAARPKDWLFWLSQQPMPSETPTKNIFYYDSGSVSTRSSVIVSNRQSEEAIRLYQVVGKQPISPGDHILLRDGFGKALLSRRENKRRVEYRFSSRIDPAFNDLPWNSEFPQFIYQLIYGSDKVQQHDQRYLDSKQVIQDQYILQEAGFVATAAGHPRDLSKYLWTVVFLLFLLERVLSYFKQKNKQHAG